MAPKGKSSDRPRSGRSRKLAGRLTGSLFSSFHVSLQFGRSRKVSGRLTGSLFGVTCFPLARKLTGRFWYNLPEHLPEGSGRYIFRVSQQMLRKSGQSHTSLIAGMSSFSIIRINRVSEFPEAKRKLTGRSPETYTAFVAKGPFSTPPILTRAWAIPC